MMKMKAEMSEERRAVVLKALKENERVVAVARKNPFDKFLLWASPAAEDAVFKTVNLDDMEDIRWFDKFLCASHVGHGKQERHVPDKNPALKEILRQVWEVAQ
jgi:hypothetical protein